MHMYMYMYAVTGNNKKQFINFSHTHVRTYHTQNKNVWVQWLISATHVHVHIHNNCGNGIKKM